MDIEFLDCDYEWVDLDALAAAEAESAPGAEPEYMGWFTAAAEHAPAQANA